MITVICISCLKELELNDTNFYKSKRNKTGFTGQCKSCRDLVIKKRIEIPEVKEKNKRVAKQRREENIEKEREKARERSKKRVASGRSAEYQREYRQKNLDKARNQCKQWQLDNPEKHRNHIRLYNERHPGARAISSRNAMLRKHKITQEDYDLNFENQNGVCFICKKTQDKNLTVDHDHACCAKAHSCGECIRGLLCSKCNTMLGLAGDDIELLLNAVDYLINTPKFLRKSEFL